MIIFTQHNMTYPSFGGHCSPLRFFQRGPDRDLAVLRLFLSPHLPSDRFGSFLARRSAGSLLLEPHDPDPPRDIREDPRQRYCDLRLRCDSYSEKRPDLGGSGFNLRREGTDPRGRPPAHPEKRKKMISPICSTCSKIAPLVTPKRWVCHVVLCKNNH